jgi:nitrite reductase (NO-forming)
VLVLQAPTWEDVDHGYKPLATALAIGFAAQLLVGALSYLVPSVLGGGPSVVRTGLAWLDRWSTARLVATNLGLLLVLLPVPDSVKVAGGVLVGAAVLTFVPLMGAGIRAAVTAREELLTEVAQRPADG